MAGHDGPLLLSAQRSVLLVHRHTAAITLEIIGVSSATELKILFRNISAWDIIEILRKETSRIQDAEIRADKSLIESTNARTFREAVDALDGAQIKLRNVAHRFTVHVKILDTDLASVLDMSSASGKGVRADTVAIKGFPRDWLSKSALRSCGPHAVPMPMPMPQTGDGAASALEVRDFDTSLVTELLGAFGAVKAVDVRDIEPGAKSEDGKAAAQTQDIKESRAAKRPRKHSDEKKRSKRKKQARRPPSQQSSSGSETDEYSDESDGDLDKEERRLRKKQTPQWPAVDTSVVYVQFASDEALTRALEALCCNGRACLVRNTARPEGQNAVLAELSAALDSTAFMADVARRRRKFDRDGRTRMETARLEKLQAAFLDIEARRRQRQEHREERARLRTERREQKRLARLERERLEAERRQQEREEREREERRRAAEERARVERERREQMEREEKERAEREALERALATARDTKRKRCANVFRVLLKMAADTKRRRDEEQERRARENELIEKEKRLEADIARLEARQAKLHAALTEATRPKRKLKSVVSRPQSRK